MPFNPFAQSRQTPSAPASRQAERMAATPRNLVEQAENSGPAEPAETAVAEEDDSWQAAWGVIPDDLQNDAENGAEQHTERAGGASPEFDDSFAQAFGRPQPGSETSDPQQTAGEGDDSFTPAFDRTPTIERDGGDEELATERTQDTGPVRRPAAWPEGREPLSWRDMPAEPDDAPTGFWIDDEPLDWSTGGIPEPEPDREAQTDDDGPSTLVGGDVFGWPDDGDDELAPASGRSETFGTGPADGGIEELAGGFDKLADPAEPAPRRRLVMPKPARALAVGAAVLAVVLVLAGLMFGYNALNSHRKASEAAGVRDKACSSLRDKGKTWTELESQIKALGESPAKDPLPRVCPADTAEAQAAAENADRATETERTRLSAVLGQRWAPERQSLNDLAGDKPQAQEDTLRQATALAARTPASLDEFNQMTEQARTLIADAANQQAASDAARVQQAVPQTAPTPAPTPAAPAPKAAEPNVPRHRSTPRATRPRPQESAPPRPAAPGAPAPAPTPSRPAAPDPGRSDVDM